MVNVQIIGMTEVGSAIGDLQINYLTTVFNRWATVKLILVIVMTSLNPLISGFFWLNWFQPPV